MAEGFFQFSNSIIDEIINFSTSNFDLLFMWGEFGVQKSEIIEKAVYDLEDNNLIFRHFCFKNSVIDDFLLNFYDKLKSFSIAKKISLKKYSEGDFKSKVSHYFREIQNNCIVIVENFEKVSANTEIVDFLSHLGAYKNVKIIVSTTDETQNLFRFKNIRMKTLEIKGLSKENFLDKLNFFVSKLDKDTQNSLFEITQGKDLYLDIIIKYCSNTTVNMKDLILEFEMRDLSFEKFMTQKFLMIVPVMYRELFYILAILSHPVNLNFIETYNLAETSRINYILNNSLINKFQSELYIKDYFKRYILENLSLQQKAQYYQKLVSSYEKELAKSPKDRLLRLSRESIRKEIGHFLDSAPQLKHAPRQKPLNPYTYIGLAGYNRESQNTQAQEKLNKIKERKEFLEKRQKEISAITPKAKLKTTDKDTIIEYINKSREYSSNYDYKSAIDILIRALELDFEFEFKIEICTLIAKNYELLDDYTTAREYYSEALICARNTKDLRVAEIEYLISKADKNLYKIDLAQEELTKIIQNKKYPDKYRALSCIDLAEIEEANQKFYDAIGHYEEGIELSLGKNIEITAKGYFRLAVLYDENNDIENAIKFYKKNYMLSSDKSENRFYSISLTNLAIIYNEQSRYEEAIEYLKMALDFDRENNDTEDVYTTQRELAKLYSSIDFNSSILYYDSALESAKALDDSFKIAFINFEKGELYFERFMDKDALSCFLSARIALKNKFSNNDENIEKINSRINDIKIRLPKQDFREILEKYENPYENPL